ncbi:unnamed protein product [Brassica rapa]|uniref:Uncharacterized protein n=1 Tax=Brassica campestris TaxID=3711 RepID=A0A3P5YXV2_BRACM|nr:unnamed protein product [Brassica rapa]VDC72612.1 unnamed protein product [Brassica rapa]
MNFGFDVSISSDFGVIRPVTVPASHLFFGGRPALFPASVPSSPIRWSFRVFSPPSAELLLASSLLPVDESGHFLTRVHASPGERTRGGRRVTLFLNGLVIWA